MLENAVDRPTDLYIQNLYPGTKRLPQEFKGLVPSQPTLSRFFVARYTRAYSNTDRKGFTRWLYIPDWHVHVEITIVEKSQMPAMESLEGRFHI